LPFQVLVTSPPADPSNFAKAAWLGVRQPMTVLPSVASLQALRKLASTSRATHPFIGFGNPLLDGNPAIAWQATLATQARELQRCSDGQVQRVAALAEVRGAVRPRARGGLADVVEIKRQLPLPETTRELCAIARTLGVPDSEIRLGGNASETQLKSLSASGRLAEYRVVHFATHGALSGEVEGMSEPGMILTPPDKATEADDGFLTASEIAQLKLDADWVILSACNTAGGGEQGGEALSGLARAFFYAGARALLVSHWSLDSEATVRLISEAFTQLQRDPNIGRAEAMRRSAIALINSNEPLAAHPTFWAPFVVVGEGGR
jgi:CHAT domain-containing protein